MAVQSYRRPGLVLRRGGGASRQQVRDLQRDLRALGYLRRGIDGLFGPGTEAAVRALSHDLLHNDGRGRDGPAPLAVRDFNRGRVTALTAACDAALAACIGELLDAPDFGRVPAATDPVRANAAVRERLAGLRGLGVPMPFLLAVFRQESGARHYREPAPGDADSFVVVGLDHGDRAHPEAVTSRGYGIGQHTLFHHPPSRQEIAASVVDPEANVRAAAAHLREKFERFLVGRSAGTQADDRLAEAGWVPLRPCRYAPRDPRYMRDCRACLHAAQGLDVDRTTALHAGTTKRFRPTANYRGPVAYRGVPRRADIPCDWPYAVRRYNGAGVDSYHYQARVLLHLLAPA